VDRLTHHADVTSIEGDSYRFHESESESAPMATSKCSTCGQVKMLHLGRQ
jgi:hypothetical protein